MEDEGRLIRDSHLFFHLVLRPSRAEGLAKVLGRTRFLYTQYINRWYGRSGHLWQNRFFSCPMDEAHTLAALRYLERNPGRARLVKTAVNYPWSSAKAHCSGADSLGLLDLRAWVGSGAAKE